MFRLRCHKELLIQSFTGHTNVKIFLLYFHSIVCYSIQQEVELWDLVLRRCSDFWKLYPYSSIRFSNWYTNLFKHSVEFLLLYFFVFNYSIFIHCVVTYLLSCESFMDILNRFWPVSYSASTWCYVLWSSIGYGMLQTLIDFDIRH